MKKILVVTLSILVLAALLAFGLYRMSWRRPASPLATEESAIPFQTSALDGGVLMTRTDTRTPLRTLRWPHPLPGGFALAQVVTQSDRQMFALFKNGTFLQQYVVPKPEGVRDGFFRLAEIRDAFISEGDVAVLLYAMPGARADEPSLVLALDLATQEVRWFHQGVGDRLAGEGSVVYLFSAKTKPVRLPLALAQNEKNSPEGARASATTLDLPTEISEITALLPTGPWSFLVTHRGGLSAYAGPKGWVHHPTPPDAPGWFKSFQGALAPAPKGGWWQPYPGTMIQVQSNGTPKAIWTPSELLTAAPYEKDASLLRFLGTDPEGRLWFDLAVPTENTAVATKPLPPPDPNDDGIPKLDVPEPEPATVLLEDWSSYTAKGLRRLYRWDPAANTLQRFHLDNLKLPQGFPKPSSLTLSNPASGALLFEHEASAWWMPLSALTLGEASTPVASNQPM